mmetsp:Transcript_1445/g.3593  ORF Transcript_1445/g.3593 Transcript_1445/m.3593 type:complete len:261 (+) Transcript_1445:749-1531(+)
MFYHASTEFFYDPKSKLYYGNKQKAYFRYCVGENPPFQELVNNDAAEKESQEEDDAKALPEKKTIAICLKTKLLPETSREEEKVDEKTEQKVALSRTQKTHAENMSRWLERGKEDSESNVLLRTKSGQPVCLLCRRKFQSAEKLHRHEKLSDLHKTNLAKKKEMAAQLYRDRAQERRMLHGADAPAIFKKVEETVEPRKAEAANPEDNLGASNIGNKMLQKLGWKSGSSLGRNFGESTLGGEIQKDWERIEALAGPNSRQ